MFSLNAKYWVLKVIFYYIFQFKLQKIKVIFKSVSSIYLSEI